MLPLTSQHLATAEENRQLAERIVTDAASSPDLIRWASVIAFYAAVQYVNAFLAENWTVPGTHVERERAMRLFRTPLRPIIPPYQTLKSKSLAVRYAPTSRITRSQLRSLLDNELYAIRVAIVNALRP